MTEPQQEIFLAAKLDDDASCSFNESFSVYMRGPLQVPALNEALNALIARHEALRATVAADGTTLHFSPELKLELPLCDLSKVDQSAHEAEVQRLLAKDARMAFDLTGGPLVRIQLIRLDADSHVLIFTSHHIICDGWSTNVLLNDLAELYSARVQGRQPELKSPVCFSQYARAELAKRGSAESTKIESYWLSKFKDTPAPLDLPLDRPRSGLRSYSGATLRAQIDAEAYRKIKQLGAKKGCTLFATLLAGYQTLLPSPLGSSSISSQCSTAGRSLLDDGGEFWATACSSAVIPRGASVWVAGRRKENVTRCLRSQSYVPDARTANSLYPRDPAKLRLSSGFSKLEQLRLA